MDHEIRQAAEQVVNSNSYNNVGSPLSPNVEISHSHSINTIPSIHTDYIISEDLLAGQVLDGRMSDVRRFFCMFVTFDLLLTSLMWLICVMLNGDNIMKALSEQIYHYNIHTSLFDIVLAAVCRFVVLLLFYACISMNHWIVISISTSLTCMFLIAKVFVFDWPKSSQPVLEVLLVLTSFVLSWGEVWFLDFRVLPKEARSRRYLITRDFERAPLINNYINNTAPYTESFYSPRESPEGSMHRFNNAHLTNKYPRVQLTAQQERGYKLAANEAFQISWDLLNHTDWKVTSSNAVDSVESMTWPKFGKIFKLKALIDAPAKFLLEEFFYHVEKIPTWNSTLLESHKVQIIDEHTDITYQIAAEGAKGLVKSRDFVNLRHWRLLEDGCYVIASIATQHPSIPKSDKYVRGENGPGCWMLKEISDNQCEFHWVLNTALNGWLPPNIKDKAMPKMMLDYAGYLRQYVVKLKESGKIRGD